MKKAINDSVMPAFACIVAVAQTSAADWPQWRGQNRDAKVTDFKVPATWPKELKQEWRVPVGDGVATLSYVKGKLFVIGREGGSEVVRCLDGETGKEIWKDSYETPAATGPASPTGTLTAFEPSQKEFKQVASYKVGEGGTTAYPIVDGKHLYVKDKDSVTKWTIE